MVIKFKTYTMMNNKLSPDFRSHREQSRFVKLVSIATIFQMDPDWDEGVVEETRINCQKEADRLKFPHGWQACGRRTTEDFKILLEKTFDLISGVQFMNVDFRKFFANFQIRETEEQHFIYCDPPYLGTGDNYSNSFNETDSKDLFNLLQETKCKWAMSEFDHPFILQEAKERNLNVIIIGERQNLKNRRTEILITNYEKQKGLFD